MMEPAKDQERTVQSASSLWSLWVAVMDIYFANVSTLALCIQKRHYLSIGLLYDIGE